MSTLGLHERECLSCRARCMAPTFVGSPEQAAEYAKCPTCGSATRAATSVTQYCERVIAQHPKQVEWYREGRSVMGFLVGQVQRACLGGYDSEQIRETLKRLLDRKP
jgi:Asp-tRNA(Asn)/Glu-tRNA(Gln) amidotransferase B subunit